MLDVRKRVKLGRVRTTLTTAALAACLFFLEGCSAASSDEHGVGADGGGEDATRGLDAQSDGAPLVEAGDDAGDGDAADPFTVDAGDGGCFLPTGVFGKCITTTACAELTDHTSTAGYCPGAADIECCSVTPNVDDNPPVPTGWELMEQSEVTSAMTTWAVDILNDPMMYPMFSTAMQTFGTLLVLARVEWHPPDFQNGVVHRGVTLYKQI